MSIRQQVMARQDAEIDASTKRAIAAREAQPPRRMSALESMAIRLGVSEDELTASLTKTVFAGCRSKAEFLALIVVANEYRLNPLTKEIYAFPAKGGGVVPMVSVDGWISLMNSNPQFDGIEFEYHQDEKGEIVAIESIIYRKDRGRPIKVIEYLEECRRNTDPWKNTPRRMLRHRALIQGARVAFGFTGIYAQGDENNGVIEADWSVASGPAVLPSNGDFASNVDHPTEEGYDPETGEQLPTDPQTGMTEVPEEVARELDAGDDQGDADIQSAKEREAPQDEQPAWLGEVRTLRVAIANAKTLKALDAIEREWVNRIINLVTEEAVARSVDSDINAKRAALKAEG
jgi:phage recombination protein Bet